MLPPLNALCVVRTSESSMNRPSIERDGWTLVSAEERHEQNPTSFWIPPRARRDALQPGDAAKLLFDIETKEHGNVVDRGVDRMWVIVKRRTESGYLGVLDSDPGVAENFELRPGHLVLFAAEHICDIGAPPRQYVIDTYGAEFFDDG
jgi:hypothetical protein